MTRVRLVAHLERAARRLIRRGVQRGDRVGLIRPMSIEWATTALGVIRAGGILCPLNERYTASELASVLTTTTPSALGASANHATTIAEATTAANSRCNFLPLEDFTT